MTYTSWWRAAVILVPLTIAFCSLGIWLAESCPWWTLFFYAIALHLCGWYAGYYTEPWVVREYEEKKS